MEGFTRRDFLKLGARMATLMGLGATAIPTLATGLEELAANGLPVLWLQGLSCSGCSISLLNADAPTPADLLTRYISLLFHPTLSTATGRTGMDVIDKSIKTGNYILVLEGAIPAQMPTACRLGEKPYPDVVVAAASAARAVIALGSCAAFGGIPAAENNPTGAVGVADFLRQKRIDTPVITLPGCPAHPDWLTGTILYVHRFGVPKLDDLGRPTMFFSRLVHDQCPRYSDYEREHFARWPGDEGCLFKLGCLGAVTHADCPVRGWNSRTNTCVLAGSPCIGCAGESFARRISVPFYTLERARDSEKGGRS